MKMQRSDTIKMYFLRKKNRQKERYTAKSEEIRGTPSKNNIN